METRMERHMVRTFRTVPAALLALGLASAAVAQQPTAPVTPLRFAWLNSQAILAATPGRPEAESLFAREMASARAEVQRMTAHLDSGVAEFNRTGITLS